MKPSRTDQIAAGLIASGCTELTSPSTRYRKFQRPDRDDTFFWVGEYGTLRVGMMISRTFMVPERLIEKYIRAGCRR